MPTTYSPHIEPLGQGPDRSTPRRTPGRKLTRAEQRIISTAEARGEEPDPVALYLARDSRLTASQRSAQARLDMAGDDLSLTEACRIAPGLLGRPEIARKMAERGALPFDLVESSRGPRVRTRDLADLLGIPLSADDPRNPHPGSHAP